MKEQRINFTKAKALKASIAQWQLAADHGFTKGEALDEVLKDSELRKELGLPDSITRDDITFDCFLCQYSFEATHIKELPGSFSGASCVRCPIRWAPGFTRYACETAPSPYATFTSSIYGDDHAATIDVLDFLKDESNYKYRNPLWKLK